MGTTAGARCGTRRPFRHAFFKTGQRGDHRNGLPKLAGATLVPSASTAPNRTSCSSACEPHRETIELALARGRNARAIWQDLVSEIGFVSSYESVKRFVAKLRGTQSPEARAVIVAAPGEECQVDYGSGPWSAILTPASIAAPGSSS